MYGRKIVLEVVLQTELDIAFPLRTLDHAQSGANSVSRRVQDRRIRKIDEFAPEFQVLAFRDRKSLHQAHIDSAEPRPPDRAVAAITESARSSRRIGRGVEPHKSALGD